MTSGLTVRHTRAEFQPDAALALPRSGVDVWAARDVLGEWLGPLTQTDHSAERRMLPVFQLDPTIEFVAIRKLTRSTSPPR